MELKDRINLLSKPIWAEKDITIYFGVGRHVAKSMLEEAIVRANGAVYGFPTRVKSESVISLYCGHSKKEEMEILGAGIKYEDVI